MKTSSSGKILDFARDLVLRGGDLALDRFGRAVPRFKADHSVVTEADKAVEEWIVGEIQKHFPGHSILAEEGTFQVSDPAGPLWIIDPIDGTSAFSHCLPVWGVSVAFYERMRGVAAAFFLPVIGDLYTATWDGPARLGEEELPRLVPSELTTESMICISSDFHLRARCTYPGKARALGSLAANLCYVARGSAVGAFNQESHLWDIAAGALVLERVGGVVRVFDGSTPDFATMVATTRTGGFLAAGHEEMLAKIKPYIEPFPAEPSR